MGDGAADSTGKGEARVQSEASELVRLSSLGVLDDGIELGRASGLSVGGHCECDVFIKDKTTRREKRTVSGEGETLW